MNPIQAVLSGFINYANFDGRATRSEYWWFYGFFAALLIAIFVASLAWNPILFTLWVAYLVAMLPPVLSVTVRRLHDLNRPGNWAMLALIPFAGVRLTRLLVQPGTPGPNRYGPDPLRRATRSTPPQPGVSHAPNRPPRHTQDTPTASRSAPPCPRCSMEREHNAQFCGNCGAAL